MTASQKQAARKFVERWTFRRGSEKGEDQQFWNSLLGEVLGMDDVVSRVQYQVPVFMKDTTKFLDAWIPENRVLIEHKSRGVNLDAPQTGHDGQTPYEQAIEYDNARPFDRPRTQRTQRRARMFCAKKPELPSSRPTPSAKGNPSRRCGSRSSNGRGLKSTSLTEPSAETMKRSPARKPTSIA